MDNRAPTLAYGPNRLVAAVAGVGVLAFLALLLEMDDRTGRVLYGLAVVALAAVCVSDLVWNPRLVVDRRGLTVRTPSASGFIPWADVERVRIDERTRLGLSARTLEIDAGPRLMIFSRRALGGADPRDVAAVIAALQPPAERP